MSDRIEQANHILVVDADEHAGAELSRVLERLGNRVRFVSDVQQMMVSLRAEDYDVLLITADLLDRSPEDVLRNVRLTGCGAGVIVVAEQPDIDSVLKALRGRAVDYLISPYGLDDLTGAIHRAVSESRERCQGDTPKMDCCSRLGKAGGTDR
jgi:DNA-binding NtrC family response regulator